jgi:hypothetical protein
MLFVEPAGLQNEAHPRANMNVKRVIGAGIVAFVILFVAGYLVHAVWLANTYRVMTDQGFSFRLQSDAQQKLWIVLVSDLLYSIVFSWIYARGLEPQPWANQGVRYGILMTLFTIVPASLSDYVVYNLPSMLVVRWMVAGLVTLVAMGLAVAAIQGPST